MATLEDKILGNKLHNYCSSSEDSDDENSESDSEVQDKTQEVTPQTPPEPNKWEGTSSNTGPKGVIKDWQRFKQLETESHTENERERIELMKRLTLTVQSALDEEKEQVAREDPELAELLIDDFLLAYQKKRMEEMLKQNRHNLKFGKVVYLKSGQEYLDAIDKENRNVTVIIHIYEERVEACRTMNLCLNDLSKLYDDVKFCTIISSLAGMSADFKMNGVPALLIYKAGQLVGNFVRLSDDLGDDFCTEDVQGYLVEHGMLEDKTCMPLLIKSAGGNTGEADSD